MATMPAQYKSSLQTLEGKLLLAFNLIGAVGVVAAATVDVATKQAVFSHYANQLSFLATALLAYNGYFAKLRTNYKTALIALDAPVNTPTSGNFAS